MTFSYGRTALFALGVTSLGVLIAGASPSLPGAAARPRVLGVQPLRTYGTGIEPATARSSPRRGRSSFTNPSPCPTDAAAGTFFVGIPNANDVAGATDSSVLGGDMNEACDGDSGVGAGVGNKVGNSGLAQFSFIAGGFGNSITGFDAFVGGGFLNEAAQVSSFVGSGVYGIANGDGSFVGAGGEAYYMGRKNAPSSGNAANATDSFVGAGDLNVIESTGSGSFIGAGGSITAAGSAPANNQISGTDAFIGAGNQNTVDGTEGFIGSGDNNAIASSASYASIVGGNRNNVSGEYASIIGGYGNVASGSYGIVAGGDTSTAAGIVSFAAGYHADATHNGSFVWSDYASGSAAVKDTAANQFVVRASGGTYVYSNEGATSGVKLAAGSGTWASLSDRNAKTDVVPLDDASILAKVAALPVSAWRYKTESGVRHVGPMAQDFYSAFRVGEDDRHITSIDEDGVALAAIKALNAKLERKEGANRQLRVKVALLESRFAALEARVAALAPRER
jgi:Chaperone of endosialidase